MWILNFLPNWIFHLTLIAGILVLLSSWLLSAIPFIKSYGLPLQVLGIILVVLGVWYEGGISKDNEWKIKVSELEIKVAQAEAMSAEINTKIVTKYITRTKVIEKQGDVIKEYIEKEVAISDAACKIPQSAITAHDASAAGIEIKDVVLSTDSTVSTRDFNKAAQPKAKRPWQDFLPKN
jgi:hypothetical protein